LSSFKKIKSISFYKEANAGFQFTKQHVDLLLQMGITSLTIEPSDTPAFVSLLRENGEKLLSRLTVLTIANWQHPEKAILIKELQEQYPNLTVVTS
jgi:hypothetical protein